MSAEKPRQIAVRVLKRYDRHSEYLAHLLEQEFAATSLSPADRALLQELTFGVVRWKSALDWLIARKTENRAQKGGIQTLLQLGLYQILFLDRIPDHAAVHETVEQAKALGFGPQSGFINAILRSYAKEKSATQLLLRNLQHQEPAVGFSHPKWLCDRWQTRYGTDALQKMLTWNNTPPSTFARINTLRASLEQLLHRWQQEKVQFTPRSFPWLPDETMFELHSHPSLASLPSFVEGLFYIQDPSTLLAVHALDPQPGQAILDSCAAPGGKTTYIAQLMANKGYIMAQDLDIRRRELIRQNCDRLGVTIVQIARGTTTLNDELSEPFDRILVDAPCSNSGVIRRRLDLRYRLQPAELRRLPAIQTELLHQAARQLRVGGLLVYSTCSLEPEENEDVVHYILKAHPELELLEQHQLLPFNDGCDGAYIAKLRRTSLNPAHAP